MSENATPKKDDDFDMIYIGVIALVFSFMMIKLLFIPFFYLSGFLVTPIYALGFLGGLIVFLLSLIPFAWHLKKTKFNDPVKSLMACLASLTFGFLYLLMSLLRGASTNFISAVCQGEMSSKWAWVTACPPPMSLIEVGVLQVVGLMAFVNLLWVVPIFAKLGIKFSVATNPPINQYKGGLDIEKYISMQKEVYSHLKFYQKVNPLDFPLYKGEYRILDNAKRFIFTNRLVSGFTQRPKETIQNGKATQDENSIIEQAIDPKNFIPVLDNFLLEQEMLKQLGSVYVSIEALNDLEAILFSIIVPRFYAISPSMPDDEANATLKQYFADVDELWGVVASRVTVHKDKSVTIHKDLPERYIQKRREILQKALENEKYNQLFFDITNRHAFVSTILSEVVTQTRRLGVLQPSEFSWLLYHNRSLWAVINNIGRPSYFLEGIAPCVHWEFEKRFGGKIFVIDIEAIKQSINAELKPYHFSPELISKWELYLKTHDNSIFEGDEFFADDTSEVDLVRNEYQKLLDKDGELEKPFNIDDIPVEQLQPKTGNPDLDKKIVQEIQGGATA